MHWSQAAIKRAATAIRESNSTDTFIMARRALEAAIRTEADILEPLSAEQPAPRRSIREAAPAQLEVHA